VASYENVSLDSTVSLTYVSSGRVPSTVSVRQKVRRIREISPSTLTSDSRSGDEP
jgi:hypothetical protein